jgi:hypothetical protein
MLMGGWLIKNDGFTLLVAVFPASATALFLLPAPLSEQTSNGHHFITSSLSICRSRLKTYVLSLISLRSHFLINLLIVNGTYVLNAVFSYQHLNNSVS